MKPSETQYNPVKPGKIGFHSVLQPVLFHGSFRTRVKIGVAADGPTQCRHFVFFVCVQRHRFLIFGSTSRCLFVCLFVCLSVVPCAMWSGDPMVKRRPSASLYASTPHLFVYRPTSTSSSPSTSPCHAGQPSLVRPAQPSTSNLT